MAKHKSIPEQAKRKRKSSSLEFRPPEHKCPLFPPHDKTGNIIHQFFGKDLLRITIPPCLPHPAASRKVPLSRKTLTQRDTMCHYIKIVRGSARLYPPALKTLKSVLHFGYFKPLFFCSFRREGQAKTKTTTTTKTRVLCDGKPNVMVGACLH